MLILKLYTISLIIFGAFSLVKLLSQKITVKKYQLLNLKKLLLNNKLIILGAIIGGVAGYIYYIQIECGEGLCVIGAHPFNSIIYFALFGGFLMSLIQAKIKDNKRK